MFDLKPLRYLCCVAVYSKSDLLQICSLRLGHQKGLEPALTKVQDLEIAGFVHLRAQLKICMNS